MLCLKSLWTVLRWKKGMRAIYATAGKCYNSVQLATLNFVFYKWDTERCTNLFTFQNLLDDQPQQLSRSKYLMNSASSAAEMTLNRLNFASKLTPSDLHPSPQTVTLGHPAPTQRDTFRCIKDVGECAIMRDCFNLETMLVKNFLTPSALCKPKPNSWFRSTLFPAYCPQLILWLRFVLLFLW